ncbi:MAG TPA: J domain-containing protein [Chloroflexi bacterium]|nr:J domain-containing protein [Chloroflexota bacterium]
MEYKDYYQTLGVTKDASEKEIKQAFRKMARQYHPDVNPGDTQSEERFKEVNEAYEVLSDPEKRSKYDQLGSAWRDWDRMGGRPGDFDWGQWAAGGPGQRVHVQYGTPEDLQDLFGGGSPFSDFFTQVFGGMGGAGGARAGTRSPGGFQYRTRPQRGQDYEQEVEISLREAYQGTTRVLQKDGRRLEVKIPPGSRTGTRVRMSGEGGAGAGGGGAGDLYLRVNVAPDPQFERKGDDLHVSVPMDLYTAVLGGQAQVPTLSGPVVLTIPQGTQNGRTFRLRGKGMPRLKQPDQWGDLYAQVDVQLPTTLTPRQRELFEELQRLSKEPGD